MVYICHRGKKNQHEPENEISNIIKNISLGYDCEIDIWKINDKIYIGHDYTKYEIDIKFLLTNSKKLWCHAKNIEALHYLLQFKELNSFWHQDDDYTLTSKNYIWVYPNKPLIEGCISVMPENTDYSICDLSVCHAICTDEVEYYIKKINVLI